MALQGEFHKSELIQRVAELTREKLPWGEADTVERFVRIFYAHVPPTDMFGEEPEELYGAALALWRFGLQRAPTTATETGAAVVPNIRVYNPRYEEHGWISRHTVVEVVHDDMPFLIDSITSELSRHNLTIHLIVHPIVWIRRDSIGRVLELHERDTAPAEASPEAYLHIEVDERTEPETLEGLTRAISAVLTDVRAAVEDWGPMRARIEQIVAELSKQPVQEVLPCPPEETAEALEFLEWLVQDHFTFLGYRERSLEATDGEQQAKVVPESGLGVLRDEYASVLGDGWDQSPLPETVGENLPLVVTKANRHATVHRPALMDTLIIPTYNPQGRTTGDKVFVGLFTSVAYDRSIRDIPLLRKKAQRTLEQTGFDVDGHNYATLYHILETFPRGELFQIDGPTLFDISLGILNLQERQRVALFHRIEPFRRFASCLVYIPRDRFHTDLRQRLQGILERALHGECIAFTTQVAESVLARVHYTIRIDAEKLPEYDPAEIEACLAEAARSWSDRLRDALVEYYGEEKGLELFRRYGEAFPVAYEEYFSAAAAVLDIERIEQVLDTGEVTLNLYRPIEAAPHQLRFKLYYQGNPVPLSQVMPLLEHMGLHVINEIPFGLRIAEGDGTPNHTLSVWINDFETETANQQAVDPSETKVLFQEAFSRIWKGEMEDDGFNRLVLLAGLEWREVSLLRTYAKYLRQTQIPFSHAILADTLATYPEIAQRIITLFHTRLNPDRLASEEAIATQRELEAALKQVENLDDDRILRRFINLVLGTIRTNYFQVTEQGTPKPYLALKLDGHVLKELPHPRPMTEIFVYSPQVEAIHLRCGKVARGGVRWSSRREDFRTEVLALMKAQQVKNAIIVPVGAKGGFIAKRLPSGGREAIEAEVLACYRTMIAGMLDLTDNLVKGQLKVPPRVVRRDAADSGDDPYLVVAPDKGTATFSDAANQLAAEYGFWLDDAFASGGSAGYDHKRIGITARGAWEAIKRHFRELGTDIENEPFTVVGIGDMSGDVFGNAMLLSDQIRLLGAFNHLHIFVDPEPDPAASYAERKRLFERSYGSWGDYDRQVLSEGGRVFDRSAKEIELSPQIQARFGIDHARLTPNELIRALLQGHVDLLWFGGIGTFIKAPEEPHAAVGDKINDAIRVDADQVRARVIGEGANLAITQAGRIVFAQRGGCINTDFIDNSAGVDCSDHEVNLKVLLGEVMDAGELTRKQRNQLLTEMTDEVARAVLRDNYLQSQALTLAEAQASELLDQEARLMRSLERAGLLDRALEGLPDEEVLAERAAEHRGMTRPELAVLLCYAKIALYDALLASTLPDDPYLSKDLAAYFPSAIRERFGQAIESHPLRRELIATSITNELINRMGPAFVHEMGERTGLRPSDIAQAYTITREIFDLPRLWGQVEALDGQVQPSVQIRLFQALFGLADRTVGWLLRYYGNALDIGPRVNQFRRAVQELASNWHTVVPDEVRSLITERVHGMTAEGIPEGLAESIATVNLVAAACDLARIVRSSPQGRRLTAQEVAPIYFELGQRLGIAWLRDNAKRIKTVNDWDKRAVAGLIDDLYELQAELTVRVVQTKGRRQSLRAAFEAWLAQSSEPVERVGKLLTELRTHGDLDLSMMLVASRRLRGLTGGLH